VWLARAARCFRTVFTDATVCVYVWLTVVSPLNGRVCNLAGPRFCMYTQIDFSHAYIHTHDTDHQIYILYIYIYVFLHIFLHIMAKIMMFHNREGVWVGLVWFGLDGGLFICMWICHLLYSPIATAAIASPCTASRAASAAATPLASPSTASAATAATFSRSPRGHLNADAGATAAGAIQAAGCVLRIATILELDEGEAGRIAGHPDVAQGSVFAEGVLNLVFGGRGAQVAHVHFAGQIPFPVAWHYARCVCVCVCVCSF